MWTTAGLLAIVLAVGGLGVNALLRGSGQSGTAVVNVGATATATATDTRTGAGASIVVTGEEDRVTVRATVTGLRPDADYVLYAAMRDGQTREVTRWTSGGQVDDVNGPLAGVGVSDLAFVTVAEPTGGVVLTVELPRGGQD